MFENNHNHHQSPPGAPPQESSGTGISATPGAPAADPAVRRTILGATDGPAILGVSPWRTAVDVWMEKTGRVEPEDLEHVEAIQIGRALEDDVAQLYHQRTGFGLAKCMHTVHHKSHSFIACHPDYVAFHDDSEHPEANLRWLVECKTAGIASPMNYDKRLEWGIEGSDEIPHVYLVQCHHQMLCNPDVPYVHLAALIGGRGYLQYPVHRDKEFLRWYEAQLVAFWRDHVEADIPPEPTTLSDVKVLYRKDSGQEIDGSMDSGLVASIDNLRNIRDKIKWLTALEDEQELAIKKFMGDAATLVVDGQIAATWKSSETARIDTKKLRQRHPEIAAQVTSVTSSRRFLLKERKES